MEAVKSKKTLIIAVEGGMAAGKTTLCEYASKTNGIGYVREYMDFINDPDSFYKLPKEQRLEKLFEIESKDRKKQFNTLMHDPRINVILLDRSFLTLLAHEYATGNTSALNAPALNKSQIITPDMVIYIEADKSVRKKRHQERRGAGNAINNLLFQDAYDKKFLEFITQKNKSFPVYVVQNTNKTPQAVWSEIKKVIRKVFFSSDTRKTPRPPF